MKILLVNPPYPFEECPAPPFGLISLAAYLIREGFDVKIDDYIVEPYSRERVREVIDEFRPDVVGSTAVTMNVKKALSILNDFREEAPGIVTVIGGPHATFDSDNMLRNSHIDYVVRGEGEITMTELLRAVESGNSAADITGVSYRDGDGIIHNGARPLIPDINILPYPARDLVQLSKYRAMGFTVNMVTSRGCPHSCIFCVGQRMVGNRVRYFDVDRVVYEFEMLSKLGFQQINIVDDLFTANKKRCIDICDGIIARGIKHQWSAFARVDTVYEDLLEKLLEAGCTTLCFGIESGNQEILDRVKKKTTLEKCRRAAELCRKTGMTPMASYILGLPGETEETVRKTIEFADELNISYGFHIMSPFPGTEVREKADEYGITILTDDWDLYDANRSVCSTGGISTGEVDRIVNEFESKIKRKIESLKPLLERGDRLTDKDQALINGLESFIFNRTLITGKLVERYPGNRSEGALPLMKDFSLYISGQTELKNDVIERELRRLAELGCIEEISDGKGERIVWC